MKAKMFYARMVGVRTRQLIANIELVEELPAAYDSFALDRFPMHILLLAVPLADYMPLADSTDQRFIVVLNKNTVMIFDESFKLKLEHELPAKTAGPVVARCRSLTSQWTDEGLTMIEAELSIGDGTKRMKVHLHNGETLHGPLANVVATVEGSLT